MPRNTHKDPIEYIEQRVRYYKTNIRAYKKWIREQSMALHYSDDEIRAIIKFHESKKAKFEKALSILKKAL